MSTMSDGTEAATAPAVPAASTPSGPTLGAALRTVAIAAAIGSAVIHFALAPAHLDMRTVEGVFFLAVAWGQVAVALALWRWADRAEPWVAALALNAGVTLVWLGSRTIGVPDTHHTSVAFPDALAAALQVTVVVAALLSLRSSTAGRPFPAVNPLAAGALGVALAGLVSVSVAPAFSGESGGHDEMAGTDHHGTNMAGMDHHGGGAVQQVAAADRCDLGFNTAAFNEASVPGTPHAHSDTAGVDFTLEEWAEVFANPESGIQPEVIVGFLNDRPALKDSILGGALTHTLDPDPWNPMTDEAQCEQLERELLDAKEVAKRHPTVTEAEAAGYRRVTPYYPGIAAHYIKGSLLDDEFVLEEPEMLLYDGTEPDSNIVGLSYLINKEGDEEPTVGFTGNNDHYHIHEGLCFRDGVVIAGSTASHEECAELGGQKADGSSGWMSHVWIVPGCESDWGVFSGANPALEIRGGGRWGAGCGTGKTLDDPLAFETGGNGPQELAAG
jgi:hypothetical protein